MQNRYLPEVQHGAEKVQQYVPCEQLRKELRTSQRSVNYISRNDSRGRFILTAHLNEGTIMLVSTEE